MSELQTTKSDDASDAAPPTPTPAGPSPGTGSLATAMIDDAHAGGGQALDDRARTKMEGAFGQDFSDVKVHTGGAATQAAKNLNAQAFTQGSDIFFDQGKYDPASDVGEKLIAHELAHVAQTGAGKNSGAPAAKANSISQQSDSAETAADAAAEKAVSGEAVGDVGAAPAATVHRDALGDLKDAADGNWLGSVNDEKVLAKTRALSAGDKAQLKTDKYDALNRRVMKKLSASNCLFYLNEIGGLDVRWKLYWLNEGNNLDELEASQWRWLLGYSSPATMDLLRKYPTGYKAFLKNAPHDMIPAWDRLQGLEDGTWNGNAQEIRTAVNNLNADQKAQVRADDGKLMKIMTAGGDTNERFRIVTYLDMKVKEQVRWLNWIKALPTLTTQQWSQLLAECSKADFDELVGWAEMFALVQKHCPPAILQVTRQNSDPAVAANAFDDPVQVESMFGTLGPVGFLAEATKNPAPAALDHVYTKARAKVGPTVTGIPKGQQMGAITKTNLRKWMFTASSSQAECQAMFEQRFAIDTHTLGTYDHLHDSDGNRNSNTLTPFTKVGLTEMWGVCETLPPSAVEGNPRLLHILRDSNRGTGSAYYAGPRQGAQGDVLMGGRTDADIQTDTSSYGVLNAGASGPGSPEISLKTFNATLRHEIGHAVDSQLGIMQSWGQQQVAGGWIKYDSFEAFVDAIIAASGGMRYGGEDLNRKYRKGMIDAVSASPQITFSAALTAAGVTPPATDPGGAVSVVWEPERYSPANDGPWYNHKWVTRGDRNFQTAYGSATSLYSFLANVRTNRMITDYQWRAPGEWFAEVYQIYYAETENPTLAEPGVQAPVGGRLRAKDEEAAQMMSQLVDRGFSPQDMTNGKTEKAPGT